MCEILNEPAKTIIDIKVELLKDMRILRGNAHKQEEAVRIILATCQSAYNVDTKLHDLIVGNETIAEFIRRHEYILTQQKGA